MKKHYLIVKDNNPYGPLGSVVSLFLKAATPHLESGAFEEYNGQRVSATKEKVEDIEIVKAPKKSKSKK